MELINDRLKQAWPMRWPERSLEEIEIEVKDNIEAAIEAWELKITGRIDTGWVSVVLEVEDIDGQRLILKAAPIHDGMRREAQLAATLPQHVPLLGERDEGMTLLLERADPGTPLSESSPLIRARECGRAAAAIHAADVDMPLPSYLEAVEKYESKCRDLLTSRNIDPQVFALGKAALDELAGSEQGVCHGDLHADNLLLHRDQWMFIDCKGWRGPLAFECMELIDPATVPGLFDSAPTSDALRASVEEWGLGAGISQEEAWTGLAARAWYQACASMFRDRPERSRTAQRLELVRFASEQA
jgi:streptomycin 6-kinase